MQSTETERFAPSPTGKLHLGHAFSALLAHDAARAAGGRFLLRLEDLDPGRVRTEFSAAILEDLAWLGITWDAPPLIQSERIAAHGAALARLEEMGLVYCCDCTRRDIADAAAAPQEGATGGGPDGPAYPGTCRGRGLQPGPGRARRLDMARAIGHLGHSAVALLSFEEIGRAPDGAQGQITLDPDALLETAGDIVLARKDAMPSYHLAVVIDDAFQSVTTVTRGEDLFTATAIHRLLQALLELPVPRYRHHRLIRDENGKRLAKRHDALAISELRAQGWSPERLRAVALGPAPDC